MGEATPAQPAAGTFVPMLGVGLGAMPGGPLGVGVGGPQSSSTSSSSRGSAVPQLHNAIVERLRARIELCRRHHSTCENRYQRGQAESSDREHESTLHLLNIVHQGPGNRKTKGGGRGSNQQPPEYSRANGEQKGAEGEQKISTRIALQGSLRRKIEGHAPGPAAKQNGLSCGFSGSDFKRARLDNGGLGSGHGSCNHNLGQSSHPLQGSSPGMGSMQRKGYMLPHGLGSDIFNMTLKEMKKEPCEIQSCGQSGADMIFDFKDEGGGQIDPDLQDLFDELTKSVPPLNDLEFEKMLKQDDAFGLDLGRPSSAGAAGGGSLCAPMDKPIKTEHSPDFGQVHCGSPQLRPASAGPSFALTGAGSSAAASQKPGAQAGHGRSLACWPEISHAEQLKQMAANQQQPGSLLHHHHPQTPPVALTSWAPAMSTHSSTSTFAQDGVPSPGPLSQQRMGPLSKGINNCLFKSNGHGGSHHLDMKVLSTKPTLHFSPKAPPHSSASQPMPVMAGAVTRTDQQQQQQQSPPSGQNQPHSGLHFQNQQISTPGGICLQPKSGPAGLPFRLAQQRQGVPAGPRLPANGGLGIMSAQPRPPTAPNNQQKGPAKAAAAAAAMPRQLNSQPHNIVTSDKDNASDQFSRRLTRPPPDYKQSRSMVGVQQGSMFTGPNSSQPPSNGLDSSLQSMSCHLPGGPAPKMAPSPSDRRFGVGTDCHPSPCVGQFPQQSRVALNQSKPRFLGPSAQVKSFGMNSVAGVQHQRPTADLHSLGVPGQGLGPLMANVGMGWGGPAGKQATAGLGVRRLPNPMQSQAAQDLYQQRHVGPPNQVAPDMGMLPLNNPSMRDAGPRPSQAMIGSPSAVGNLNQASPEQRVPAGNFAEPNPGCSSYQSGRANRLTFDFLPEGDNTVPGINADSDFIDSLLKSGSGNDDWMKDINLDEILGSHS